nr:MAG TPA: hypothetical protein [Caudoviricetes sp.]
MQTGYRTGNPSAGGRAGYRLACRGRNGIQPD